MTLYSYSRVDLFEKCPYHYKLRYIDRLTELPRLVADNPLFLGHALHKGIESGLNAMHKDYFNSYPLVTNEQVNEMMKLDILLPKVIAELSPFDDCQQLHEYRIMTSGFIGFADLILVAPDKTATVIDFKYSNHVENYMESGQLHLYKYYLEKLGFDVQHLAYMFIPKTGIRQKNAEDLYQFRKRLVKTVSQMAVKLVPVQYNEMRVIEFHNAIKEIKGATDYPKNPSGDCFSCMPRFAPNYLEAIQNEKGVIKMKLPKNKRRSKKVDLMPDVWLYADSYVGKTTFWDQFDDVLMVNTDGNTDNITSPVVALKDEVTKEGRMTKRKFAWENFLELVKDFEVGNPEGFKTIVIDLMEDVRTDSRNYIMDKYNWEHESDGSYGKGWSMVTNEFDNAIKRLKAVGLQIVYISRELRKDVTLKGNSVRTTYQPNIDDKTANFLTGTVDITMRAYVNEEGEHKLMLQKQPNVFGGGRFDFKQAEIPLEKDAFLQALKDAQPDVTEPVKAEQKESQEQSESSEATNEEAAEKPKRERRTRNTERSEETPESEEKPKRRQRKARKPKTDDDQVTPPGEDDSETATTEEKPTAKPRRRRRRRTESED